MSNWTAAHGTAVVPGVGVNVTYSSSGATISPKSGTASVGHFLCPIPNPANTPIVAKGIKIDAKYTLTNLTNVTLYSGDNPVAVKSGPIPPVFTIAAANGQDDDGWCLDVCVEFLNSGSSILVKSCAIAF